jgi:hypothetical protein
MDLRFDGKAPIVAGAASGTGHAIAGALAESGAPPPGAATVFPDVQPL